MKYQKITLRKNLSDTQTDLLETIVDQTSMSSVLESLISIAFAKAVHIRNTWQDDVLANTWERIGKRLDTACTVVSNAEGVPHE